MEEQDAQTIWSWLESSGVAVAMRQWTWLYPIVEVTHIIGFVVLVGAAFMFDLRLLGISRGLPVTQLGRHLLGWSRVGLLIVVPTGFLMFMTNAMKLSGNPVFRMKLILIVFAGINALVFRVWISNSIKYWDVHESSPLAAKLSAVFSLVAWSAVISCGRLMAFF